MKPTLPLVAALLCSAVVACSESPPPEVPKGAPPPPPPLPKCEALAEACLARADTKARLPGLDWTITPPKGWRYAQLADVTVAEQSKDTGAVLAITSFAPPKASWELKKARIDALDALAKSWNVQLAFKNIVDLHLRGPDIPDTLDVAGVKLSIWEQEGAKRGAAPGNVVAVVGSVDERELVVIAFVPKAGSAAAEADSQSVSAAIQSLAFKKRESKPSDSKGGSAKP